MSEITEIVNQAIQQEQPAVASTETETKQAPASLQESINAIIPPKEEPRIDQNDLMKRFALLSKREKQLFEKERSWKDQLKEKETLLQKLKEYEEIKSLLADNPLAAFDKLGMSYDDVTKKVLTNPEQNYSNKLKTYEEKLEQLHKTIEDLNSKLENKEKAQAEQANEQIVTQFKNQIKADVSKDLDRFELINKTESYDLVYLAIKSYFDQTQEVLAIDKAAELVESHLETQAKMFLGAKKLQPALEPTQPNKSQNPLSQTTLNSNIVNHTTPANKELATLPREDAIKAIAAKYSKVGK